MPTGYPDYTLELAGTVQVANGGTGLTTWPANAIPLGNGNQPMGYVEPWTSGVPVQANPAGGFSCGYVNNAGYPMPLSADASGVTLKLQGNYPSSAYIPCIAFYDWGNSATLATILAALAAGQGVSNSLVDDFIIQSLAGRILLAQGSAGPQLILDSGGLRSPLVETYNGLTTVGQGHPVIVGALSVGPLTGSTSYTETLLASAPAGMYRVCAQLYQISGAGSGNMSVSVSYTENAATRTTAVAPAVATGAGGDHTEGVAFIRSDATANITLTLTTNNSTGSFDCWAVLERLV
jgi:hypothetical protein